MITFLLTITAILAVGMLIPHLLVRSIIGPGFRLFVVPGVMVHELGHAFFCIITGAPIKRIRFFKREGGEVAHGHSKIPFLGPLLITFAPLVIGFVILIALAHLLMPNLHGSALVQSGLTIHQFPAFFLIVIHQINWLSIKSLILLYLILSVAATLAPSIQDFKNSWIPLVIIIAIIAFVLKTGHFMAQFTSLATMLLPWASAALMILLVVGTVALVIYILSSIFGISR